MKRTAYVPRRPVFRAAIVTVRLDAGAGGAGVAGVVCANADGRRRKSDSSALSAALTDYDNLNLTQWDFSPLTPLVKCAP